MKLKQLEPANVNRKQVLVFVNGTLSLEGSDYDWDCIDEEPIFKYELTDGDLVDVLTLDSTFGNSRKTYTVEDALKRLL